MKNVIAPDHPFSHLDGLGLAALVRRKEVAPQELLEWAIANVAAVDPTLNCIAHRHEDAARAQIGAGLPVGPFRGVPFLVKDLGVELAGTVTSMGSRAWLEGPPSVHDSELVARYKRAGLVIFGKTTSPELGITFVTESRAFGLTRNPWDLTRTPGGSSGGSAAALATGMSALELGSDIGA
ncbi:MAG TPA: amidase family protein, partial [Myxococcaceae bacterium]|nr:amidase family protein [Myxococcaceae bacterium]